MRVHWVLIAISSRPQFSVTLFHFTQPKRFSPALQFDGGGNIGYNLPAKYSDRNAYKIQNPVAEGTGSA